MHPRTARSRHLARARRCAWVATISVVLAGAAPAWAQVADAETLFNDADRLMTEGQIEKACAAFEASNRIEPRAGTLIRLGQCREKNRQLASAWSAYKDALTRVKDPAKRELALARIAIVEPQLSTLTVTLADDHRVAGMTITRNGKPLELELCNRAAPIDGGSYTIVVGAPGYVNWSTTVDVPPFLGRVGVKVPALERLPDAPLTGGAPPRALTTRRKVALGLAGAGGASLVAGVVVGITANGRESDAYALCPDPAIACAGAARANELVRSGHRLAITADVMFGVAGAAAIGAAVLWITGSREPRRLTAMPTTNGLLVVGAF
jgi:hypothetical protein